MNEKTVLRLILIAVVCVSINPSIVYCAEKELPSAEVTTADLKEAAQILQESQQKMMLLERKLNERKLVLLAENEDCAQAQKTINSLEKKIGIARQNLEVLFQRDAEYARIKREEELEKKSIAISRKKLQQHIVQRRETGADIKKDSR